MNRIERWRGEIRKDPLSFWANEIGRFVLVVSMYAAMFRPVWISNVTGNPATFMSRVLVVICASVLGIVLLAWREHRVRVRRMKEEDARLEEEWRFRHAKRVN